MSFAQNLRYLMKEHGYKSNYKLAQVANVSQTTIGNWVKGKTIPYPKELENLGIIFNVSSEELLANKLPPIRTKTDEKTPAPPTENGLDERKQRVISLLDQLSEEQQDLIIARLEDAVRSLKALDAPLKSD